MLSIEKTYSLHYLLNLFVLDSLATEIEMSVKFFLHIPSNAFRITLKVQSGSSDHFLDDISFCVMSGFLFYSVPYNTLPDVVKMLCTAMSTSYLYAIKKTNMKRISYLPPFVQYKYIHINHFSLGTLHRLIVVEYVVFVPF